MAFEANIIIGAAPLEIVFTDTTLGSTVAWYWQFGDGETSTEQNPSHIYTEEGRYTVSLEVTYEDTTTDDFEEEDYILVDEVKLEGVTRSLRFSTEQSEGFGWSEFGSDNIVIPMDNYGAITLEDDSGRKRDIYFDASDFGIYEGDTCDRYLNAKPSAMDKNVADIEGEKWERESVLDRTEDNKLMTHEVSNVSIRPDDVANRGASGYTVTGQRYNQKLTLEAYVGGEKITPAAISGKMTEDGETSFTGIRVKNSRVQMVIKTATGEIQVTGHTHKFIGDAGSPKPAKRLPGDNSVIMELMKDKILWLCKGHNKLLNRCTGIQLTGGTVTSIAGPDGNTSGFMSTENITCDNAAVAVESTIVLWSKDTNLIFGISSWSNYSVEYNGWTMYYKYMTTGLTANLIILAGSKFDVRFYNKRLGSDAIAELYNNITLFNGKKVLPVA